MWKGTCSVPLTATAGKPYQTLRLTVIIQQTSRMNQYSLLTSTQTVMIMMTMTKLINPTHQIQLFNFIHYNENDNDSDIQSADSTNSKSLSIQPLTQKLFSGSNSQPNNRSKVSKDGRLRNSVDSRGKHM
jgi:hypothetical protein